MLLEIFGCAALPPTPEVTRSEQVRIDNAVGRNLVEKLDFHVIRTHDADVVRYLSDLMQTLAATSPELKETPIQIILVENSDGGWRNYAVPGVKVYLSVSLLKTIGFENELAAALALELSHIMKRNLLHHVLSPDSVGGTPAQGHVFVRPEHFMFTEPEWVDSITEAVRVLYDAHFDPRGLLSLLQRFDSQPGRSPISRGMLPVVLDSAYAATVKYPPLRNPVVRSGEFVTMQKRMKKL